MGLLQRLLETLLVLVGVAVLVFLLLHLVPGDPVQVMLGESARASDVAKLRRALGLDRPLPEQLLGFFQRLLQGDLGESLQQHRPVAALIAERLPATLELALAAFGVALLAAIPLGVTAARHVGRWPDRAASGFALLGLSIPNFWLGPMLILLFSIALGWAPVSGRDGLGSLVLPAVTLGLSMAAITMRMVRSTLLEVLDQAFIRTAHAKGQSASRVLWRHALPNAALPILTLLGLQLGGLLAGAVITETVFAWPGMGKLIIDSIFQLDRPVIVAYLIVIVCLFITINLVVDILYAILDPRVRLSDQKA